MRRLVRGRSSPGSGSGCDSSRAGPADGWLFGAGVREGLVLSETPVKSSRANCAGPCPLRNGWETCPKPRHGTTEKFLTDTEVAGRTEAPRDVPDHGVV